MRAARHLIGSVMLLGLTATNGLAQNQPATPVAPAPLTPAVQEAPKAAKPPIYDEKADARAQIRAAVEKAARNNRRVLVQWGANWCSWCHLLHETASTDKDIAKELMYEYDYVLVDVGRFDKNMDLAGELGAKLKDSGIPYLTVLDGDGKPIANQESGSLENKDQSKPSHDVAKVLEFLKSNEASHPQAESVLTGALTRANKENKQVFLHFGAPWCGWCHKLEDWMARPEIASVLAKDYIDCKIDTDRNPGADSIQQQAGSTGKEGIPWIAILDGNGKPIANSNAAGGNIGFPYQDDEIAHFEGMLKATAKNMTAEEITGLVRSLRENRQKSEPASH